MSKLEAFLNRIEKAHGVTYDDLREESVINNAFRYLPLAKKKLMACIASMANDKLQDEWDALSRLIKNA